MNDLISVIVPIYNVSPYLKECVDSIRNQTYGNLQILLVDDGSTDESGRIADQYAEEDGRIRVIHRENGGLSAARNTGLSVAKGTYVSFIDSDDVISCRFIETLYTAVKENQVSIAQCGFQCFYDTVPTEGKRPKAGIRMYHRIKMQEQLYRHKTGTEAVVVWNKLYHKKIFHKLGFPEGMNHEDEGTTYRLFDRADRIAVCREPLYYYRKRQGSIVNSKNQKNAYDVKGLIRERIKYYEVKDSSAYQKLCQLSWKRYYYELLKCQSISDTEEIRKELRDCARKVLAFRYVSLKSKAGILLHEMKREKNDYYKNHRRTG